MEDCVGKVASLLKAEHQRDIARVRHEHRTNTLLLFSKNFRAAKELSFWRTTDDTESVVPVLLHGESVVQTIRALHPFDWYFVCGYLLRKQRKYNCLTEDQKPYDETRSTLVAIKNTIHMYWPDDPQRRHSLDEFAKMFESFSKFSGDILVDYEDMLDDSDNELDEDSLDDTRDQLDYCDEILDDSKWLRP